MWYISSSLYLYGYFFQWEYTLIQSLQLLEEGKGFFLIPVCILSTCTAAM